MPDHARHQIALLDYVAARRAEIDAALDGWLPRPPACPPEVAEAMRYAVGAGGKRFRPLLTLAVSDAVAFASGADEAGAAARRRHALPAACAVEFVHTQSLVHDDLPAMDDDVLRRGQPTVHVRYGEGLAILVGDGLLAEAFGLLAREPGGDAAPDLVVRKLRVIAALGEAVGAAGMVGGQAIDLALTGHGRGPAAAALDLCALKDMHARKTGGLIRAAALAGAIMGGASAAQEAGIARFADRVGLAFQIVDDVLDVEGCSERLGKTAGKDARAGKVTFAALLGCARARAMAHDAVSEALDALEAAGVASPELAGLAAGVLTRLA
ncbi:MAG: polyprenyl synthetase family protein [Vicinamibacterales bacterium]